MTPTLFQRLLGAEFYHLAPEVKTLHSGPGGWRGVCEIRRGEGVLARLACTLAGLPPSMSDAPLTVQIEMRDAQEFWRRDFNGRPMTSRLGYRDGRLHERMGPMTFRFRLYRIDNELHWIAEGAKIFGLLPLPGGWLDEVRCRESGADGRYRFEVDAQLPLIGRLIRYEGWLEPEAMVTDENATEAAEQN